MKADEEKIIADIAAGRLVEAEKAIERLEAHASTNAHKARTDYLRGRLAWKQGHRADAITYYENAAQLDPEGDAAFALDQARDIMNFYHRDLYNP